MSARQHVSKIAGIALAALVVLLSPQLAEHTKADNLIDSNKSIVILIHGVNAGGQLKEVNDYAYEDFHKFAKNALGGALLIDFHWGVEPLSYSSNRVGTRADQFVGMSDFGWAASAKLKELVARLRDAIGENVKISIVAHSQGSVISLAAIEEGLPIDNWILLGSPLGDVIISDGSAQSSMIRAAQNVRSRIVNLYSSSDDVVGWLKPIFTAGGIGIGSRGLPAMLEGRLPSDASDNLLIRPPIFGDARFSIESWDREFVWDKNNQTCEIRSVPLKGVHHFGEAGWWSCKWLSNDNNEHWLKSDFKRETLVGMLRGSSPLLKQEADPYANFAKAKVRKSSSSSKSDTLNPPGIRPDGDTIFGSGANDDLAEYTFTLTKGMRTGFHFDDKDQIEFEVKALKGSADVQLKVARMYEWENDLAFPRRPRALREGEKFADKYTVPSIYDATLFLELVGTSENVAKIWCKVHARDTAMGRRFYEEADAHSIRQIPQLHESLVETQYATNENFSTEALRLLGDGMYSSVESVSTGRELATKLKALRTGRSERPAFIDAFRYIQIRNAGPQTPPPGEVATNETLFDHLARVRGDLIRTAWSTDSSPDAIKIEISPLTRELLVTRKRLEQRLAWKVDKLINELDDAGDAEGIATIKSNLADLPFEAAADLQRDEINLGRLGLWTRKSERFLLTVLGEEDREAKTNLDQLMRFAQETNWNRVSGDRDQSSVATSWLLENGEKLDEFLNRLQLRLDKAQRATAPIRAIDYLLRPGQVIRFCADQHRPINPHLAVRVGAVTPAQGQRLRPRFSGKLFLCFPPTSYESVTITIPNKKTSESKTTKFNPLSEDLPLGIEIADCTLPQGLWFVAKEAVLLEEYKQIDELRGHPPRVAQDLQSFDISLAIKQFLDTNRDISPASLLSVNRVAGGVPAQFTDKLAATRILRRLGVPSFLCESANVSKVDDEFTSIELDCEFPLPIVGEPTRVRLAIDLDKEEFNVDDIRNSLINQIKRHAASQMTRKLKGKLFEFDHKGILFKLNDLRVATIDADQGLECRAGLEISLPGDKATSLGQWQVVFRLTDSSAKANKLAPQTPLSDALAIDSEKVRLTLVTANYKSGFSIRNLAGMVLNPELVKLPNIFSREEFVQQVQELVKAIKVTRGKILTRKSELAVTVSVAIHNKSGRVESDDVISIPLTTGQKAITGLTEAIRHVLRSFVVSLSKEWASNHGEMYAGTLYAELAEWLTKKSIDFGFFTLRCQKVDVDGSALRLGHVEVFANNTKLATIVNSVLVLTGEVDDQKKVTDNVKTFFVKALQSQKIYFDLSKARLIPNSNASLNVKQVIPGLAIANEHVDIQPLQITRSKDGLWGISSTLEFTHLPLSLAMPRLRISFYPSSAQLLVEVEQSSVNPRQWRTLKKEGDIAKIVTTALKEEANKHIDGVDIDVFGYGVLGVDSITEMSLNDPFSLTIKGHFITRDGLNIPATVSVPSSPLKVVINSDQALAAAIGKLLDNLLNGIVSSPVEVKLKGDDAESRYPAKLVDVTCRLNFGGGEFVVGIHGCRVSTRGLSKPQMISAGFPTPIPIGPSLWLANPTITIPIDGEKKMGAGGDLVWPEQTAGNIAKIRCQLDLSLDNGLRAEASGTTVLFVVLPVYENTGSFHVSPDASVEVTLGARTVGVARNIVKSDGTLFIDTKAGLAQADGDFTIFSVNIGHGKLEVQGGEVHLKGFVDLLTQSVEFDFKVGNGLRGVSGKGHIDALKVGGYKVSAIDIAVSPEQAIVGFSVAGMRASVTAPNLNAVTMPWFRRAVLDLVESLTKDLLDPETYRKVAQQIASGKVTIQRGTLGGQPTPAGTRPKNDGKPGGGKKRNRKKQRRRNDGPHRQPNGKKTDTDEDFEQNDVPSFDRGDLRFELVADDNDSSSKKIYLSYKDFRQEQPQNLRNEYESAFQSKRWFDQWIWLPDGSKDKASAIAPEFESRTGYRTSFIKVAVLAPDNNGRNVCDIIEFGKRGKKYSIDKGEFKVVCEVANSVDKLGHTLSDRIAKAIKDEDNGSSALSSVEWHLFRQLLRQKVYENNDLQDESDRFKIINNESVRTSHKVDGVMVPVTRHFYLVTIKSSGDKNELQVVERLGGTQFRVFQSSPLFALLKNRPALSALLHIEANAAANKSNLGLYSTPKEPSKITDVLFCTSPATRDNYFTVFQAAGNGSVGKRLVIRYPKNTDTELQALSLSRTQAKNNADFTTLIHQCLQDNWDEIRIERRQRPRVLVCIDDLGQPNWRLAIIEESVTGNFLKGKNLRNDLAVSGQQIEARFKRKIAPPQAAFGFSDLSTKPARERLIENLLRSKLRGKETEYYWERHFLANPIGLLFDSSDSD